MNFLYREGEQEGGDFLKIIDFEYSELNYQGVDLASLANETTINYNCDRPFIEYHHDKFLELIQN